MELNSILAQGSVSHAAKRTTNHGSIASELALHSDERLSELLCKATPLGTSIGGTSALIEVCGSPIFVKKIRLTEIERRPENRMATRNLFELPVYLQYGMSGSIGSIGFGAWRELAAHVMTTSWVLSGECQNFPLLYHWRELPRPELKPLTSEEVQSIERSVEFWEGSDSVRKRLTACSEASSELVLFLEFFPENLRVWLQRHLSDENAQETAYNLIESNLQSAISFMNSRGLLHFDVHCGNIMTDGKQLYITDFGLAMSTKFELSESESNFFKEHHNYDQCYAMTYLVRHMLNELFGTEKHKILLQDFADGRNARALSPHIFSMIAKQAPTALRMNEFFKKIKYESKLTPYPSLVAEHVSTLKT
jgi:hypothetical protein